MTLHRCNVSVHHCTLCIPVRKRKDRLYVDTNNQATLVTFPDRVYQYTKQYDYTLVRTVRVRTLEYTNIRGSTG